jgi:hypothetical protein
VVERFTLHPEQGATRLEYTGELGADFWGLGRWWLTRLLPSGRQPSAHRSNASGMKPNDARADGGRECRSVLSSTTPDA